MKILSLFLAFLVGCGSGGSYEVSEPIETQPPIFISPSADFAYYAIQHHRWDCDASLNAALQHETFAVEFVHNSFCTKTTGYKDCDTTCLQRFVDSGRLVELDVHLINSVCQRNKNCEANEFLKDWSVDYYSNLIRNKDQAFLNKLRYYLSKAAALYLPLCKNGMVCRFSMGLEDNISKEEYRVLIEEGQKFFVGWLPIWNPVGNNPNGHTPIQGMTYENHGQNLGVTPGDTIANLDGADISFPDRPATGGYGPIDQSRVKAWREKYTQNGGKAFLWVREFNCRGDYWTPIYKRTNCPSVNMFDKVSNLQ